MKIAYLILAHNHPEQVFRLVRRLEQKDAAFVIHFDRRGSEQDFGELQHLFRDNPRVFLTERIACYWADFSLVEAAMKCIETLFSEGVDFDYAFLLSGQDYPLKTNAEIREFLHRHQGKEFLFPWALPYPEWGKKGGFDRVRFRHWNQFAVGNPIREALFLLTRVMRRLEIARKLPPGLKFYGGSQWWCLSRTALIRLRTAVRQNRKIVAFFKRVNIPDEIFFQTMLMNYCLEPDCIYKDSIRHIVWHVSAKNEHPKELGLEDLAQLVASDKLFARKFSPERGAGLLDRLDEIIVRRDTELRNTP